MRDALRFVQGAVKKNALAPELSHYLIKDGRITGFNGHMALSSPIGLDFTVRPHAGQFYRAITTCGQATSLNITKGGRLAIKSGAFRAYVDCLDIDNVYEANPEGDTILCPPNFIKHATEVFPFIGEDASRPWAMGLLIHSGLMMATNNIAIVQSWMGGDPIPVINIPRYAVSEMIRIGDCPEKLQSDGSSLTVHYSDGRWMRTQLVDPEWPFEKMNALFDFEDDPQPLPDGFKEAVGVISSFKESLSNAVYFARGGLASAQEEEIGVAYEVEGLHPGPVFSIKQMEAVVQVAAAADFTRYPQPCSFYNQDRTLRGLIIGRAS